MRLDLLPMEGLTDKEAHVLFSTEGNSAIAHSLDTVVERGLSTLLLTATALVELR